MNTNPELPRWIIDDTTRPGHILVTHTQKPRLTGELLLPDETPEEGISLPAPGGRFLAKIDWLDGPSCWEEQDLYDSLKTALKRHGVQLPDNARWRIDDTSHPGRIFCEHRIEPRLRGELLPAKQAPQEGDALPAPDNRLLCNIEWLDDIQEGIYYEAQDMYDSLTNAIREWEVDKQTNEAENQG